MSYTEQQEIDLRRRLEGDMAFYAEKCLKIVDQHEQVVGLKPKPAQMRLEQMIRYQEENGLPVRIIVLKARKEGISTWVQGRLVKRISQRENHKALVIAHDGKTAEEIFEMGETMYANLPPEMVAGLQLKPPVVSSRKGKELKLGEPSRQRRLAGHVGLNSTYLVDTANEYESGRGFTYHSLHISELGFWQSAEKKLTALLNAVPDKPNTMVIIESTANGYNRFRQMWLDAEKRRSDYLPLFIAWFEDPDYVRPFATTEEREEFIASIGTGPYGDDEPKLIERGVTAEQLNWRRWAIANRCQGDLRIFWQEYPATPDEAFLATGKQVFDPVKVSKVVERCAETDEQAEKGLLRPVEWKTVERRGRNVEVPEGAKWLAEADLGEMPLGTVPWRLWSHPRQREQTEDGPRPAGQYVVSVDAASGEEAAEGASGNEDYFSIQVIDHRTREQVASWKARYIDPDLVALEAYLAAVYFNRAWLSVETTGGYGLSIANKVWKVWRYGKIYFRKPPASKVEKQEKRLGFNTGVDTKPLLVDGMKELLRLGKDGIKSLSLAGEMITYVRDEKGKMGAEEGEHDDELMAFMIGQYVCDEKPIAPERAPAAAEAGRRVPEAPSMRVRPRAYS